MRVLVTAGNTRERIDQVRDWGNIFTGGTGLAIARALSAVGEVDLLTSNRQHLAELETQAQASSFIHAIPFNTHSELKSALATLMGRHAYHAIFMTAAVSDYRPVRVYSIVQREPDPHHAGQENWIVRSVQAGKVRGNHPAIAILGEPTEKLVNLFRLEWRHQGLLVKFKLEVGLGPEQLLRVAEESRLASQADYLVANTLDMVEGSRAGAFLLWQGGHEWVPRTELPARMVRLVTNH